MDTAILNRAIKRLGRISREQGQGARSPDEISDDLFQCACDVVNVLNGTRAAVRINELSQQYCDLILSESFQRMLDLTVHAVLDIWHKASDPPVSFPAECAVFIFDDAKARTEFNVLDQLVQEQERNQVSSRAECCQSDEQRPVPMTVMGDLLQFRGGLRGGAILALGLPAVVERLKRVSRWFRDPPSILLPIRYFNNFILEADRRHWWGSFWLAWIFVEQGTAHGNLSLKSLKLNLQATASAMQTAAEAVVDLVDAHQQVTTMPRVQERYRELRKVKAEVDPEGRYIGESLTILGVFQRIKEFNRLSDEPILILGPSGAGKSNIAKLIHEHSRRKAKKFERDQASGNMATDMSLAKGRWAGYGKNVGVQGIPKEGQSGLLEECAGGTIFVDEVHLLPSAFQVFLNDVLDRKEIRPALGKGKSIVADVRLIFATNLDPEQAVIDGRINQDFLRRIRHRILRIPALDERKEDIFYFVHALCKGHKPMPKFLLTLLRHSWRGNVGELIACLKMAVAKTSANEKLTIDHLDLNEFSVAATVTSLTNDEAEMQVLQILSSILRKQGLELVPFPAGKFRAREDSVQTLSSCAKA